MSTNKTLYFDSGGQFHGAEQYFPNRRVTWKFANGDCDEGYWYMQEQAFCFVYDRAPQPQCWFFFERDGGFFAQLAEVGASSELELNFIDTKELLCKAPYLGA